MKELRTLKLESDIQDFMDCYNNNCDIIGSINIRQDVYTNYIKVLCIFPLKGKKLEYFLKLDSKSKTGYMSKYIMSIARKINVPNSIIENFQRLKKKTKFYKSIKPSAEKVGESYTNDIKEFFNDYKIVIKEEIYTEELSQMTINLCSVIFQQYDKARLQMIKEQKL